MSMNIHNTFFQHIGETGRLFHRKTSKFSEYVRGRLRRILNISRKYKYISGPVFTFRLGTASDYSQLEKFWHGSPASFIIFPFLPWRLKVKTILKSGLTGETVFEGEGRIDTTNRLLRQLIGILKQDDLARYVRSHTKKTYIQTLAQLSAGGPYGLGTAKLRTPGYGNGLFIPSGAARKLLRFMERDGAGSEYLYEHEFPFPGLTRLYKRLLQISLHIDSELIRKAIAPPFFIPRSQDADVSILIFRSHSIKRSGSEDFDQKAPTSTTGMEIAVFVGLMTENEYIEGWLPLYRNSCSPGILSRTLSPVVSIKTASDGIETFFGSSMKNIYFKEKFVPQRPFATGDRLPGRLSATTQIFYPDREGDIHLFEIEQKYPVNHLYYMTDDNNYNDTSIDDYLEEMMGINIKMRDPALHMSSMATHVSNHRVIPVSQLMIRLPAVDIEPLPQRSRKAVKLTGYEDHFE